MRSRAGSWVSWVVREECGWFRIHGDEVIWGLMGPWGEYLMEIT